MPTAFEQRQQAAMNQGFVPSAAPMVNDNPVIGQVTSTEATPGPFVPGGGPPGTMTTTDVTLYGFYQEFADLEQSEQESYAEALISQKELWLLAVPTICQRLINDLQVKKKRL